MFRNVAGWYSQAGRSRDSRRSVRHRGRIQPRLELLESRALLSGTWTSLTNGAPASLGTMELLSDGTVMAQGGGVSNAWYRLTPDATGSYQNGSWSSLASMSLPRLYTATTVLQNGNVFELGAEYSGSTGSQNWSNTGELYNSVTNTWSSLPNFPQSQFGDDPSMLLPDGRVLAGYLSGPQTYIYDPATNAWTTGGTKLRSDSSDEETWVKLPDGSILTYEVWTEASGTGHAQRYIPSTNTWVDAGTVPVALSGGSAYGYEMGPGSLLPDGRAFFVGANGHTAFYTPSTNSWAAGPNVPNAGGADDSPGALLPDGHILLAVDTPLFKTPTRLYDFDPVANSYTEVTSGGPSVSGVAAYNTRMLVLPSGQVLFNPSSSQLYLYTPGGSPQAAWKPTITGVVPNGSNFTLTGTQINGLDAGASYGDDASMDTNYPIIELKSSTGTVSFARTFNWSSTGVATGSTPVTTDFSLPAGLPNGTYALTVVANGIASAPYSFTVGASSGTADLAVTNVGPSTANEGDTVSYTLTVTNNGPNSATGTVLADNLGTNFKFLSSTTTLGTFSQSNGVVTFSVGTLASGQTVTATVTAQVIEDGALAVVASASSNASDPNSSNNTASVTTTAAEVPIVVSAPITTSSKKVNNLAIATFTHANGVEATSAITATINWGDGRTSTGTITLSGTTYTVRGSHNYTQGGTHTITTTVVEPANSGGNPGGHGGNGDDALPGAVRLSLASSGIQQDQNTPAPSAITGAGELLLIPGVNSNAPQSEPLVQPDLLEVIALTAKAGKKKFAARAGS